MNIAKVHRVRTALVCLLCALALALCACGSILPSNGDTSSSTATPKKSKTKPTSTIEGLQSDGVLTVGIRSTSTAPFVVETRKCTTGLDIDLGNSLASELGLKVSFVTVDDVLDGLANGCDIVMNVTAEEAEGFQVIGHYVDSATAFFHRGSAEVQQAADLQDKSVGVQDNSSAQRALRITNFNAEEKSYTSLGDAFDSLELGTVDYVLCHTSTGAYMCTRHKGVSFAGTLSEPVAAGITVVNGNEAVRDAVSEAYARLEENGVLSEVRRCWLGDLPLLTQESQIANVPMKETTGESLESLSTGAESLTTVMDGSTAGANAVVL